MMRTVQDRTSQIIEARVEQVERVFAHLLDRTNFSDQESALGDEIATRFEFERQLVAELFLEPLARSVPEVVVLGDVDVGVAGLVDRRQAAAGADRRQRPTDLLGQRFHRAADLRQMFEVGP